MNAQTLPAPTSAPAQAASGLLPIPPHFDPTRADKVWKVDYLKLMAGATDWYRRHDIAPAAADDVKVALLHYSPCPATLAGEPPEIYPFLGSGHLAEAVDRGGAALAFHGHAHRGSHEGATPAGVPVRNVALPVIGHAYACFDLEVAAVA